MKCNRFTAVAVEAARAGAAVLERRFARPLQVSYKGKIDPVTAADLASQKAIVRVIRRHFPDHEIMAEENMSGVGTARYRWIIDPLDGTVNFLHGVPHFCVSVALTDNGTAIAGVVCAPLLRETFVAQKGGGAWLNGKRIHVSKVATLLRSLTVTGFSYRIHEEYRDVLATFERVLRSAQGMRRLGSAAIDLGWVACGRFEAFWEEGLAPWDVAAGGLILQEAGGKVTDFAGRQNWLFGKELLATNGRIHRPLQRLMHPR